MSLCAFTVTPVAAAVGAKATIIVTAAEARTTAVTTGRADTRVTNISMEDDVRMLWAGRSCWL